MNNGSLAPLRLPPMPCSSVKLRFATGSSAQAVYAQAIDGLPGALDQLGLQRSRPVLVLVGGASHLSLPDYQRLTGLFNHLLAPMAEELGMTVIDGGTNAGVMQLMGLARAACGGSFPLVGVAPLGKVQLPDQPPLIQTHQLEPNHSHFLLVPGESWGAESPWIAKTASLLAGASPSLTLLLNGGNIALVDLRESIANARPVLVMTGTGRLADEIELALRNPEAEMRVGLSAVVQSGLVEISKSTAQLRRALCSHLQPTGPRPLPRQPRMARPGQPIPQSMGQSMGQSVVKPA